ncbi:DNA cytosine methyltransferase [Rhodomicrobium udaipurense]|uniref:DNA cytosine methyltransferase n=3 Tax=Rhodomicrobium udaipurense TaxID=1202716 RepID=UPI0030B91B9D
MIEGLIIDSFAGGGGASTGIELALGRSPDYAINHDAKALAMHAANHPLTIHLEENIWKVDPHALLQGRQVGLLWASPDCRHHSKAKGGAPVSRSVRMLADVVLVWARVAKPHVIALENVEEFADWGPLDTNGRPDKDRRGQDFARWVRGLEAEGYEVQWRQLRACDYGAPTIRKRLYLIARRDGHPILWPEPTHGNPKSEAVKSGALAPWRTAAEIIDWSLKCPSIFLTKGEAKAAALRVIRPLAPKTLSRIARGFKRYVLDRSDPFIVRVDQTSGDAARKGVHSVDEPLRTVHTAGSFAAVTPHLMTMRNSGKPFQGADEPTHTVTAGGAGLSVIAPQVMVFRADHDGKAMDEPLPTVTANSFQKRPGGASPLGLATAQLAPFVTYGQQGGASRPVDEPHHTVCASTKDTNSVAAVYLAQHNGNGVIGRDAGEPLSTITTSAANQQPVMAYLSTLQGKSAGVAVDEPLGTVLAQGQHHGVVTPYLAGVGGRMGQSGERPVEATYHTITTKPDTVLVAPMLSAYYGTGEGAPEDEPARTVTTRDRFGHVEGSLESPPLADWQIKRARAVAAFLRAEGVWDGGEFVTLGDYVVWDIGMRMLTPRELARAQGFPDSYILAAPLPGGGTLTETAQRHKIGNSICPPVAAAIIRANCIEALTRPQVKRRRASVPGRVSVGHVPQQHQSTLLEDAA